MVPDIASAYKGRMKVADLDTAEEVAIFEKTKSEIEAAGIEFANDLDVVRVTMDPPTLEDTMPDLERGDQGCPESMLGGAGQDPVFCDEKHGGNASKI